MTTVGSFGLSIRATNDRHPPLPAASEPLRILWTVAGSLVPILGNVVFGLTEIALGMVFRDGIAMARPRRFGVKYPKGVGRAQHGLQGFHDGFELLGRIQQIRPDVNRNLLDALELSRAFPPPTAAIERHPIAPYYR